VLICTVHNEYRRYSGEEAVLEAEERLLTERGHEVLRFRRSSADIASIRFGKLRAFVSGLGGGAIRKEFARLLEAERPDIVHVHNLYPLISPAVLEVCRQANVPVVMTVHNFRLVCPNGLFFSRGSVCERCSGGKEYWCVLRNCEESPPKSLGYALRNAIARRHHYFDRNIDIFAVLTEFQRRKLTQTGFPPARTVMLPNMCEFPPAPEDHGIGDRVGFLGRMTLEKGVHVFVEAARRCPDLPFQAAGSWGSAAEPPFSAPKNLDLFGELPHDRVARFLSQCRAVVFPSLCYEVFPITLIEAMLNGRAVVASRTGGIPEIVLDGVTGLLFEPGDAQDLADKLRYLWERPQLCRQMGEAGKARAVKEYGGDAHYERLMAIYEEALGRAGARATSED
jgi:glycosyltransferase involved in cell wall biosynthesis